MSRSPLYRLAHPLLMLAGLAMLLSFPLGLYCDLDPDPHYTLILSTPYLIHALLNHNEFITVR